MIRKIAAIVVLLVCVWTLSGCHTVKGIGEDVQCRCIDGGPRRLPLRLTTHVTRTARCP